MRQTTRNLPWSQSSLLAFLCFKVPEHVFEINFHVLNINEKGCPPLAILVLVFDTYRIHINFSSFIIVHYIFQFEFFTFLLYLWHCVTLASKVLTAYYDGMHLRGAIPVGK